MTADAQAISPAELARLPARLQWEVFGAVLTAGDLGQARALLERITAQQGVTPLSLRAAERLAQAAGDRAAAVAAARELHEIFPSAAHAAEYVGTLLRAGQVAEAAGVAGAAQERYPEAVEVLAAGAAVALAEGDRSRARLLAEQALVRSPGQLAAGQTLARVAGAEGRRAAAIVALERLIEAHTGERAVPQSLSELAGLADDLERPDLAARLRSRAAELWRQRHAATWRAVAAALGRSPAPAAVPERDGATPEPRPAAAARPAAPGPDGVAAVAPAPADNDSALADGEPADAPELPAAVLAIVREQFGHADLRPGQAAVIGQVLAGIDTLATMPTGAGKSLTYQAAALALPGTTVVISPLIALMQDQVDSLPPAAAAVSTLINSTLEPDELRRRLDALAAGQYRLVYAAPERLRQGAFLRALRTAGVSLLVVDEAHCISLWGHDFRPDYLFIPRAAAALGNPPLLALTATATPELVDDVARQMRRPLRRVRTSVFRPNLRYEVVHLPNKEAKFRSLLDLCRRLQGAGIVYAASRETCEQLAGLLRGRGVRAAYYHAGLGTSERAAVQNDFMAGRVRVIVATVAFGMGVDKRDVRFIVHFSPAKSLEAYAQESGRAGRDGLPARCILLYTNADKGNLARWARADDIDERTLTDLYAALRGRARPANPWLILNPAALILSSADPDGEVDAGVAVGMLERAGLLNRHPDAPRELTVRLRDVPPGATDADPALAALVGLVQAEGRGGLAALATADLAQAAGLTPAELEARLSDWLDAGYLAAIGRDRETCLELLPPPPDVARRLRRLLADTRAEAKRRVETMVAYLEGETCRHAMLAAHFGERLPACGDACDVCRTGQAGDERRAADAAPEAQPARRGLTAADVAAVLAAVRTLPFPLGKSGLVKLLHGSVTSPVRPERSAQHGALAHLSAGAVGALIERLIADGYLARDEEHEYRLLSLTDRGLAADEAELAAYAEPAPAPSGGRRTDTDGAAAPGSTLMETWDERQHALFQRLKTWRYERASAESVPLYFVLQERTLRDIVAAAPRTLEDLAHINGIGPTKIERYGAELLALVTDGGAVSSESD